MMREKLFLFCALLANSLVVGIKLDRVHIPQYANIYQSVKMGCDFDLEKDSLMVLKWYKDGHEFYRFSPNSPIITFPQNAVDVDMSQSDMNQVVLQNISLDTSGKYKCEITVLPSFRTVFQQGDLIVFAPPKAPPHMECVPPSKILLGDTVNCNCTSSSSKPAASLIYYINEEQANFGDMVEYLPLAESYGLETSVLGLSFQVESRHLTNGLLEIKCTATIGNGYWVTNTTLTEASINAQPSIPGHNRLLSGGSSQSQGLLFPLSLFLGSEVMRRNLVHLSCIFE